MTWIVASFGAISLLFASTQGSATYLVLAVLLVGIAAFLYLQNRVKAVGGNPELTAD
jgi:hypothetical protein